jgi:guanine nucleotide-binding protein subunit alpha
MESTLDHRKWIQQFDNVTMVIYCAHVSGFDQFVDEDFTVNQVEDNIQVFGKLLNNPCFKNTPFLLFFVDSDKLQEKQNSLEESFPDYQGLLVFQ